MTTAHLSTLVDLSRQLGAPEFEAALLGEGNTSVRDGDSMLVKASGANMCTANPEDFVRMDLDAALALVDEPAAGDIEVSAHFGAIAQTQGRRPSVEALLHVVLYAATEAKVIAHSHPTAVNAVLCSQSASSLVDGGLFPDQIVVLGATPLLVPYIDPGIALAREVRRRLADHITAHGAPPRVVYLQNHGMFAVGQSADEVLGMTAMAQKCARVLIGATSLGGVQYMDQADVHRIDTRPDEKYRRKLLSES